MYDATAESIPSDVPLCKPEIQLIGQYSGSDRHGSNSRRPRLSELRIGRVMAKAFAPASEAACVRCQVARRVVVPHNVTLIHLPMRSSRRMEEAPVFRVKPRASGKFAHTSGRG
jgi:hypothetical protein